MARRRMEPPVLLVLVVVVVLAAAPAVLCQTNTQDAAALEGLKSQWTNYPSSWNSGDPCGGGWDGIMCANGRVTSLRLSSVSLQGTLSSSIGQLSQLMYLDLSFNSNLGGPLPAEIGNLGELTTLILAGCSFTGNIPIAIGNLRKLWFLALNSNKFTGGIPSSIGVLTNLYWLDLADNQLTGPVPISTSTSPGLDQLVKTQHFHFNKNRLTGTLTGLFNSNMTLIHIRLDRNGFTGAIPATIGSLVKLNELNLANNKLTGSVPDLSNLTNLNVVDLSNNTFDPSAAPSWFTSLTSLASVSIVSGSLSGQVPKGLFTLPLLQQVVLSNNQFNGTLEMTGSISSQLQTVNLMDNRIVSTDTASYKKTLLLAGNPFCAEQDPNNRAFCSRQLQNASPYSTSMAKCGSAQCRDGQNVNPASCGCAFSYNGKMVFRAPFFVDLVSSAPFQLLESTMSVQLQLLPGSVALSDIHFNSDNYLQVQVKLFPTSGVTFNLSDLTKIGFYLSNQTYKPPANFGPYFFIADPYAPLAGALGGKKSKMGTGAIAGIAVAGGLLVIALIFMSMFALRQKRRAKELKERADPFASWAAGQKDSGGAPQLKGARFFSFDELKICTNNFSDNHEIGSGGYGKVYRGILGDGTRVAIKRADRNSMQGAVEFKNEIELLSRVHHRNLVSLIGFCYEQGEQMLVYEYISNGTLRENLTGSGTYLDWKKRLRIALGSARGLAYLHELADPPIIHRDIKSTNILLDDNLKAKVADFGLSKLVADTEKGHVSTQVKGTLGYLDPEYYMTQQLSEKSDVYSFGVVMLELVSGRQPIEKGRYVVREVRLAIDPADHDHHYGLRGIVDPAIRDAARTPVFRRFVQLAMRCVDESAAARPAMGAVVKEIEAMLQNEPDDGGAGGGGEGDSSADPSANEFDRYRGGGGGGPPAHPYSDVEISRGSYAGDGASDYMPYFEFAMNFDALRALMQQWRNYPSSWNSGDPCGGGWDGVMCSNGMVTSLDLSSNNGLGGPLPVEIGNLGQLTTLILAGCSFTGEIPKEIGNLPKLWFLALNSNKFTGRIPPSIGLLSNLFYLDLADNQLTGPIPISSPTSPGLDLLVQTKHFHFNKNQLTGPLTGLFNSKMTLLHILFDSNQLSGSIPAELGGVTTLEVVRLDRNGFGGAIPTNISNLVRLNQLNLASNKLTGSVPDLSTMTKLNVVDLSNNTFGTSVAPVWFTTLTSLTSVSISSGNLSGQVPKELFTLPQLQQVGLSKNALNGTLEMTGIISKQLRTVNLLNNNIFSANIESYNSTLVLVGNPLCADQDFSGHPFCSIQQVKLIAYTTSMTQCSSSAAQCPDDQSLDPANCGCASSYNGKMVFRAPSFVDVTTGEPFLQLETSLSTQLNLRPGSVYLSNIHWNSDNYLQVQVRLFPSSGVTFNLSELIKIGFDLSNQTYKPPSNFGPYFFIADPYAPSPPLLGAGGKKSKSNTGAIVGSVIVIVIVSLIVDAICLHCFGKSIICSWFIHVLRLMRRAKGTTTQQANPPASQEASRRDSVGAPEVDLPRIFDLKQLKKCTDNFSDSKKIGEGGFGTVYMGKLDNGTLVAIKCAKPERVRELSNEIEVIHKLHHRNLVRFMGYYYEQGQLMLVNEYVSNGTLKDKLTAKSASQNIPGQVLAPNQNSPEIPETRTTLDWRKRLGIALGSARALYYLHEGADKPIIHRDIKPANILIDENGNAKVADFGLSRIIPKIGNSHVLTGAIGSEGYLPPEYRTIEAATTKGDVYSFGVTMLELASGMQPAEEGIVQAVTRAMADHDPHGVVVDPAIREEAARRPDFRRFVRLALRCVDDSADARPAMGHIVKEIEDMLLCYQLSSPSSSLPYLQLPESSVESRSSTTGHAGRARLRPTPSVPGSPHALTHTNGNGVGITRSKSSPSLSAA
uniref:non-specific serine/threonine protein kinase n=1 Tax=Oryza punctata TaxID=4537 RepID=A0A0E0L3Z8_ORYPU